MTKSGEAWKSEALVECYLDGIRGGIPLASEQIDVMLRLVDASQMPVEGFADLGCGNGILAEALLGRHPNATATLVDFSEPMLDEARRQLAPFSGNCHFIKADLSDQQWRVPIANQAPFDLVVSGYAIHHLTDARKRQLYSEVHELLKPGGLFVNAEHVKSSTAWLERIWQDLLVDALYTHHSRRDSGMSRDQVAQKFVHRHDAENILAPVEDQCEWLRACGFEDVDCYFKIFELAIFGGRRPGRLKTAAAEGLSV
jgi:ubiquinone/menaquinone biosynthesis C-methylase UbiE